MSKIVQTAFKAVCEQKRNAEFGLDTFVDGRSYLQDASVRTIFRTYNVVDVISLEYSAPFLNYTVKTSCNRLLHFKIDAVGIFTFKSIPFYGGNNTPYRKPIVLPVKTQLSCL